MRGGERNLAGLEAAELAAADAPLEAALGALALFALGHVFEELDRPPPSFGAKRHEIVELGGGVRETDRAEGICERGHGASSPVPASWSTA